MAKIRITAQDARVTMTATLNDSATAKKLFDSLPVKSSAQRWGDEVYFDVPLQLPAENPQASVPSGTIAYWPDGPAFCIFFGQTPYSPVNVLGVLDGDEKLFGSVKPGDTILLDRA